MLNSMAEPEANASQKIRGLYQVEYAKLIDLGVFDGERVELIDGQVVEMSPQGPSHGWTILNLAEVLRRLIPRSMVVREQSGVVAGIKSQPEPDIAIVARPKHIRDPHPERAFLVVEVANTSLHYDLTVKAAIYAAMDVPEYWVVDVNTETVTVHTEPAASGYETKATRRRGDVISLAALPATRVTVNEIFEVLAVTADNAD